MNAMDSEQRNILQITKKNVIIYILPVAHSLTFTGIQFAKNNKVYPLALCHTFTCVSAPCSLDVMRHDTNDMMCPRKEKQTAANNRTRA